MHHQLLLEIEWYLSVAAAGLTVSLPILIAYMWLLTHTGVHSTSGGSGRSPWVKRKRPWVEVDLYSDI